MKACVGQTYNQSKENMSYFHHRTKMINLDWEKEPKKVSIFISKNIINFEDNLKCLITYLETKFNIEVEIDKYTNSDFIILIGTDGSNLYLSTLFQNSNTPPILSLTPNHYGFISFLDFCQYKELIPDILRSNAYILPRCRLNIEYRSSKGVSKYTALNDLVLSRDHESGSLVINCETLHFPFSQIIGDGVIIATPTGSTAYNKGAGGALVHPLLPVFMMTPIAALSLSARPIMFPQSADLTLKLDSDTKQSQDQIAYFSFDGTGHIPFKHGEEIVITVSPYTFNSITPTDSIAEWPARLAHLMNWNDRRLQKALSEAPMQK